MEDTKMNESHSNTDTFECPYCGEYFAEDDLVEHVPFAHGRLPNGRNKCPMCEVIHPRFQFHLHEEHGPVGRKNKDNKDEANKHRRPTHCFALCVCQHPNGKFLIVDEPCSWGWWLPAGKVDPGETFETAAIRETKEEAGIDVKLEGILQIQYTPSPSGGGRQRIVFFARPVDPFQEPKSVPDYESQGAKWATFEEISELRRTGHLRGPDPFYWAKYIKANKPIYDLDLLVLGEMQDPNNLVHKHDNREHRQISPVGYLLPFALLVFGITVMIKNS